MRTKQCVANRRVAALASSDSLQDSSGMRTDSVRDRNGERLFFSFCCFVPCRMSLFCLPRSEGRIQPPRLCAFHHATLSYTNAPNCGFPRYSGPPMSMIDSTSDSPAYSTRNCRNSTSPHDLMPVEGLRLREGQGEAETEEGIPSGEPYVLLQ